MKINFIIFWALIGVFLILVPIIFKNENTVNSLCVFMGIYILFILLETTIKILKK